MAVTTTNLVAEYVGKLAKNGTDPGNNVDPTSTWNDLVGTADGTIAGADYTTDDGWIGDGSAGSPYAFHSEGFSAATPGYVTFTTSAMWQDATFSVELWLWRASQNGANQMLFRIGDGGVSNTGYRIYNGVSNDNLSIEWGTGAGYDWRTVGTLVNSTWHHVVITYNGTTQTRYFDNSATSTNLAYSPNTALDPVMFDAVQAACWHGSVATLRLYSAALSAGDVSANYTAGVTAASTYGDAQSFTGLTVTRLLQG